MNRTWNRNQALLRDRVRRQRRAAAAAARAREAQRQGALSRRGRIRFGSIYRQRHQRLPREAWHNILSYI